MAELGFTLLMVFLIIASAAFGYILRLCEE